MVRKKPAGAYLNSKKMNDRIYPTSDTEADSPDSPITFSIETGDRYVHIEPGYLIIDVTNNDWWDTDLWYLVTSVFDNMVSITPTHVGVTASVRKDGKYICVPSTPAFVDNTLNNNQK